MSSLAVSSIPSTSFAGGLVRPSVGTNQIAGDIQTQQAGQTRSPAALKQKSSTDWLASLQAIESQLSARARQAADVNTLDISYNTKQALLSVKVEQQQTGHLVRELQFKDYKAMAYSAHGYKGTYVDFST